ncbi:MAG TPA: hypothetical protein VK176_03770 [Phycisphaerales bacterium]|nr:hypothetical protein [Phycisphaerales bacterium]
MADPFGDRSKRVAALAGRLRVLQSDLADEQPKVREEQLHAVLEQAVSEEQAQDVPAFIDELLSWFPSGLDGEAAPTPAVKAKAPEPRSAAEWAAGLAEAWKSIPESEREGLTATLTAAGILAPAPAGPSLPANVEQDLRAKLQLQPADKLDPARLLALSAMMMDFMSFCDQAAWRLWSGTSASIAPPGTDVRSNGPILRFVRNYMMGTDVNLPGLGLTPEMQRLQHLIRGVLGGVGEAGKVYGEMLWTVLSPESIKATVGSGFTKSKAEYWDLYEARAAKTLDRDEIKREIRLAIGRYVEDWMKKFNR